MATTQYGLNLLRGGQFDFGQTVETFHEREYLVDNGFLGTQNQAAGRSQFCQTVINPNAENAHINGTELNDGTQARPLKFKDHPDTNNEVGHGDVSAFKSSAVVNLTTLVT